MRDNLSGAVARLVVFVVVCLLGTFALLAIYAFAFQIYCDFSGYTDAARGIAKCMGFELALNFNLPYFATSLLRGKSLLSPVSLKNEDPGVGNKRLHARSRLPSTGSGRRCTPTA